MNILVIGRGGREHAIAKNYSEKTKSRLFIVHQVILV